MSQSSNAGDGIGVLGMLGVAFVVLKLCKVITWDWKWVLLPFWAWVPVCLVLLIIAIIITLIELASEKKNV